MCASCGKLMGIVDECPYCGADNRKVGLRLKRAAAKSKGSGSAYPVTLGFVIVNVFIFALAIAIGGFGSGGGGMEIATPNVELQFRLGLLYGPAVAAGDWWRLVMPIFLHLGVLHVFFNTYILWVAGRHVETEVGSRLTFMVYMAAGLLGFVASYFAGIGGAGASGAVMGLLGFLVVRRRLVDGHFRSPVTLWVIQLIVLTAIFGLVVSRVNNVAHLVGFVTGAGLAWLLTTVRMKKLGAALIMLTTAALAVLTVAAMAAMLLSLSGGTGADVQQVNACVGAAENALTAARRSVDPDLAQKAIDCFAAAPTLAGDAADAQQQLAKQLKVARDAHGDGDTAGEQQATHEIEQALIQFVTWLNHNAPRYGLSRTQGAM